MKTTPIKILKYSLFIIVLCVIVLQFVKPGVSVTAPLFIVIMGALALGATARGEKKDGGDRKP